MKRTLISLALLSLVVTVAEGQFWRTQRLELMAGIGPTQFFGDIGGYTPSENVLGLKDFSLKQTRFNISLGANYRLLQDVNLRFNLAYGLFSADDIIGSNITRGYRSTTNFFETALLGEYYFLKNSAENSFLFSRKNILRFRPRTWDPRSIGSRFIARIDMYVFGGVGGLGFAVNGNEALAARGIKDGGFAVVIPGGLGVKYNFSPEFNLGAEFCGRYSFSDYLEGYTSQFSQYNDVYYTLNLTMTYKFDTTNRRVWGMR